MLILQLQNGIRFPHSPDFLALASSNNTINYGASSEIIDWPLELVAANRQTNI